MVQIGVRELRRNASERMRRAHAGERIEVTRRGEVMAVLGPPPAGQLGPDGVRTLDAIHLAAAQAAGDDLGGVVTYDDRMGAVAMELGLVTVAPGR